MSNQWFRMYGEVLNDPKVQKLPPELFKVWVNALCVACNNNGTLHETLEDVSFALRMPLHETKTAFHELEKVGLLVTVGETFQFKNWKKRQYKSDVSTERVKRHRKQSRNVSETPPEQIQNRTDTEQNKELEGAEEAPAPAPSKTSGRGTRLHRDWDLPDEWGKWAEAQGMTPDAIIRECDKFKDFWIAKSGKDASKVDWEATWRNWIRRHLEEYAK